MPASSRCRMPGRSGGRRRCRSVNACSAVRVSSRIGHTEKPGSDTRFACPSWVAASDEPGVAGNVTQTLRLPRGGGGRDAALRAEDDHEMCAGELADAHPVEWRDDADVQV